MPRSARGGPCAFWLAQRGEDPLLGLRSEAVEISEPVSLGRVAQTFDGRDAELLPDAPGRLRTEPRQAQKEATSAGTTALRFVSACISPSSIDLDDLLLDRLPDPLELLRAPVERELRDRAAGLEDAGGGTAVSGDPEPVASLELHQVGEKLELPREVRVAGKLCVRERNGRPRRSYAPLYRPNFAPANRCAPPSASPPTTSSRTSRAIVPRARRGAPRGRPRARDRRQLARRHGRACRPAGRGARRTSASCTGPEKEGLGPAYIAGLSAGARRRRQAGP